MLTFVLATAFASDPLPFQRGATSAVDLEAGSAGIELGSGIVDELLTSSDLVYGELAGTVAVSDRVALFGSAQMYQNLSDDPFSTGNPRFGKVGVRVTAVRVRNFRVAPWFALDGGTQVGSWSDEVGAQVGAAMHVHHRKWSFDATVPLARVTFSEDPLDLEESVMHSGLNTSLSTTFQMDEHNALRGGLESGLPYVSYRFETHGFSVEPSVGVPFVGLKAGAQF
ncbi:MAG: hypothetical protein R3F61_23210 [Myxococcota bacterium]